MSFKETKEFIEEGDTVILYLNPNSMHSLDVKPKVLNKKGELVDNTFQTTYGALKVMSLVGQKYGSKVQLSRGYAYVLQPTPELWTLTLPHRTQIIYTPDISLIIHLLDLVPGSIVIESGKKISNSKKSSLLFPILFYIIICLSRNWKWIPFSRIYTHNTPFWSLIHV